LLEQSGHAEQSVGYLLQSLRLTGLREHVYLTRLQAVWDPLMNMGRRDEAEALLTDALRDGPAENKASVFELIRATISAGDRPFSRIA
jgi:hypothetical protein